MVVLPIISALGRWEDPEFKVPLSHAVSLKPIVGYMEPHFFFFFIKMVRIILFTVDDLMIFPPRIILWV